MVERMAGRGDDLNFMGSEAECIAAGNAFIQPRNTALDLIRACDGQAVALFQGKIATSMIGMMMGVPDLGQCPARSVQAVSILAVSGVSIAAVSPLTRSWMSRP